MTSHESSDAVDHIACFARDLSAARAARELVGRLVAGNGWSAFDVERAKLVVSELVANAVLHARSPVVLRYRLDGALRIEVTDRDPGTHPRPLPLDLHRTGGMGLALMAEMSRDWGVSRGEYTKTVWCEIAPEAVRPRVGGLQA